MADNSAFTSGMIGIEFLYWERSLTTIFPSTNGDAVEVRNSSGVPTISGSRTNNANTDEVTRLEFAGENSTPVRTVYGALAVESENILAGSETGSMHWYAAIGGSLTEFMTFNNLSSNDFSITPPAGGDINLTVSATGRLRFSDEGNTGSTWTATDILLSDGGNTEWNTFESYFGEVSLFNAINQNAATAASNFGAIDDLSDGSTSGGTEDVYLGTGAGPLGDYNTGVGYNALSVVEAGGTYNSAFGHSAGLTITLGINNIAIGSLALGGTGAKTGTGNVCVGYNTGSLLTDGHYNIALGYGAIAARSCSSSFSHNIAIGYLAIGGTAVADRTSTGNVAIGSYAMSTLTTGGNNTAVGSNALRLLTSGAGNAALGLGALYNVSEGDSNLGFGQNSGYSLTTGNYNVALGFTALYGAETSSTYNTCVGAYAGVGSTGISSNNTMVGAGAGGTAAIGVHTACVYIGFDSANNTTAASNELWIANSATTTPLIKGDFPNTLLQFNATNVAIRSTDAFNLGDPAVDGSWRFVRSGDDLVIERLESSAWVTKQTITP